MLAVDRELRVALTREAMAVRVSGFEEWTIDDDGLTSASLGHYDAAEYARQLERGA